MDVKEMLKKVFPLSYGFADNLTNLIIGIVIYLVVGSIVGLVLGLIGQLLSFIAFLFGFVGWAFGIYCTAGIVIQLLVFFKVLD
jgi:hypothetical protein